MVASVDTLVFSPSGRLYGLGEGVYQIDPHSGAALMKARSPEVIVSALWDSQAPAPLAFDNEVLTLASILQKELIVENNAGKAGKNLGEELRQRPITASSTSKARAKEAVVASPRSLASVLSSDYGHHNPAPRPATSSSQALGRGNRR